MPFTICYPLFLLHGRCREIAIKTTTHQCKKNNCKDMTEIVFKTSLNNNSGIRNLECSGLISLETEQLGMQSANFQTACKPFYVKTCQFPPPRVNLDRTYTLKSARYKVLPGRQMNTRTSLQACDQSIR